MKFTWWPTSFRDFIESTLIGIVIGGAIVIVLLYFVGG